MIYFIQSGDGGPIKIGRTANVKSRFKRLQIASPDVLTMLAVLDGHSTMEVALHKRFQDLKIRGEWYRPDAALLAWIAEHGQPHVTRSKIKKGPSINQVQVVQSRTKMEIKDSSSERGTWQRFADELLLRIQARWRRKEASKPGAP